MSMTPDADEDDFTGLRIELRDRGQLVSIPVPGVSDMSTEEFDDFVAALTATVDEWFKGRRGGRRHG